MEPYIHRVQYYETDKMGITHHSNYIRWMEEARTVFLEKLGWPYERMEKEGLVSPVLSVSCKYIEHTTYCDEISIDVKIINVSPVRFIAGYEMKNVKTGHTVLTGTSEHCFLTKDMKLLRFSKAQPELYEIFKEMEAQEGLTEG